MEQDNDRVLRRLQEFDNKLYEIESKQINDDIELLNGIANNINYLEGKVQTNINNLKKFLNDLPRLEQELTKLGVYAQMYQEIMIAFQTFTLVMGELNRQRLAWDQLIARLRR